MTKPAVQVLLVEDNTGDAVLLKGVLAQSPVPFDVKHTLELGKAVEQLNDDQPDAVLLDLGLPDSQGLDTLNGTKNHAPNTPVVLLTGLNAILAGAKLFLQKAVTTPCSCESFTDCWGDQTPSYGY